MIFFDFLFPEMPRRLKVKAPVWKTRYVAQENGSCEECF